MRRTVVLDKYDDVVSNDWFGVPLDPSSCGNCAAISVNTAARREDSTAPPLYTISTYTDMKNKCTFVVQDTTNTVIPITASSVQIIYDSSASGYVLIIEE